MIGGFGILSPVYLLLIPAVLGGLLYAYRKGGRGKEVMVSTLLIFKKLTAPPRTRQKFWPPLRFFIELILLIALSLAAAGLFQEGFKNRYGIIIDNSFSMFARNKNGERHIDIAKRDAKTFLGSLSFGEGAKVCQTSPSLSCLSNDVVDSGRAMDLIDSIEVAYGEDEIDQAVTSLLSDPSVDKVIVISDKPPATQDKPNSRVLVKSSSDLVEPLPNVAISSVRVDKLENEKTIKIGIAVAAFGLETASLDVQVDSIEIINGEMNTSAGPKRAISIAGGGVGQAEFSLPEALGYSITLLFPERASWNSVSEDDRAFIAPKVSRGGGVLVSQFTTKELGLDRISTFSFKNFKPEDPNLVINGSDFVIYHNVSTSELPDTNALYVNPLSDGPFFELIKKETENNERVEVTSWDETNPITSYLKLSLLNFTEVNALKGKLGSNAVVTTNIGPAVLGLEQNGKRYAAVGFEILPFKGNSSPILSILTLNVLKWISGRGISAGYEEVPSVLAKEDVNLIASHNGDSLPKDGMVMKPDIFLRADNTASAFNFFSEGESDTYTEKRFVIAPDLSSKNVEASNSRILGPAIVLAALLLCLFDVLLHLIRNYKRRSARA